jgi:hypothetical protein
LPEIFAHPFCLLWVTDDQLNYSRQPSISSKEIMGTNRIWFFGSLLFDLAAGNPALSARSPAA